MEPPIVPQHHSGRLDGYALLETRPTHVGQNLSLDRWRYHIYGENDRWVELTAFRPEICPGIL